MKRLVELHGVAKKVYNGKTYSYTEVYYLDYLVDETGKIDKSKLAKYYTKEQVIKNTEALKRAIYGNTNRSKRLT